MTNCAIHINNKRYSWPFSELEKSANEFELNVFQHITKWFTADEFEVLTSGSTGKPKTITHSKEAMEWSARTTAKTFDLPSGTTALCCLPLDKIAGRMMLYRAIINNWELTIRQPSGTPFYQEDRFDFVALTPFQASQTLQSTPTVLHQVGKIILGGAHVMAELVQALEPYNCLVWETYGMTETITHVAVKQLLPEKDDCFRPLENVDLTISSTGQLIIDAPHLKTPLVTNDIVNLMENQSFQLLGRKDDVINSGGVKLFPAAIEAKLSKHIPNRFFITKSPDNKLGEVVTLVMERKPLNSQEQAELKAQIATHLERFEVPRKIVYQDSFQETDTGKIIRKLPS